MAWHALFVETGKEDIVSNQIKKLLEGLNYTDYDILIPKRKLKERHQGKIVEVVKKIFPGYILFRTNDVLSIYNKMKKCNYLYRLLNNNGEIQEIGLAEIADLIYIVDNEGVIGISDIFIENDVIMVINGPLCNYTGCIIKVDKHKQRVKVLFKFQGKDYVFDLSVNLIKKLDDTEVKSNFCFK